MVTGENLSSFNVSLIGFFCILAGFLYSLVTIIGKIPSAKTHPYVIVFYSFLFGWILLAAFAKPWNYAPLFYNPLFWLYSFGYGLIPAVGSYLLYMGGLSKGLDLSKVSLIASIETVVASLIGLFYIKS